MARKRSSGFDLPERVYLFGKVYYYRPKEKGSRAVRLCTSRDDVEPRLAQYAAKPTRMDVRHLGVLLAHARKNAKTRGLQCQLTKDELHRIWERSAGRCEISGIQFDLLNPGGYRRRPLAPSIDRIDTRRPYAADNCRLVIAILNLAINEFGEELFYKVRRLRQKAHRSTEKYSKCCLILTVRNANRV